MKILVTDGSNINSLAVIRSLGPFHDIEITNSHDRFLSLCAYSKYVKKYHKIHTDVSDSSSYADELLQIIQRRGYDLVLPVGLNSYIAISKYKEKFEKVTKVIVADWEQFHTAYYRDIAVEYCQNLGIPVPYSYELNDINDLKRITKFPVVLKHSGEGKEYVKYCNDSRELDDNFREINSLSNTVVQEYINGYGCGFYGVFNNGELVSYFLHKRIQEFPVTGGASAVAESYFDNKLLEYGLLFGKSNKWHGPIMMEFKYDIDQQVYRLIEINPKLWGSLDLTIKAGIDVPKLLVDIANNKSIEQKKYKYLRYHWIFPSQFKVLCSSFSIDKAFYFLRTLFTLNTNISLRDPLPSLFQFIQGIIVGMTIIVNPGKKYPHGKLRKR
ncbi:MAG: hypothetical protein JW712_07420 [Dehalococcoidales bacterium]|nr:hypothetical protein [Dehalococcoidales bacterium]